MDKTAEPYWTLEELGALVSRALASGYAGSPNGRVREIPDGRTIRYYTTLGLVDRPSGFRRRTALYGRRHLQQLVAIKRLQAEGLSLLAVQERLLGLTPSALEALARIPAEAPPARAKRAVPEPGGPPSRADFWKQPAAAGPVVSTVQRVELAPGVELLVANQEPLGAAEVAAIERLAAPLLRHLSERIRAASAAKPDESETIHQRNDKTRVEGDADE